MSKIKTFLLFLSVMAFSVPFAAFAKQLTPTTLKGGTVVSVDKAKALHDAGTEFIDARVATEYADEHIKGAINDTYHETYPEQAKTSPKDRFDLSKLPANKNTPIVFYCNGPGCWKSYKAANAAIKAGHTHVNWLRDGIPAWEKKGFPTE